MYTFSLPEVIFNFLSVEFTKELVFEIPVIALEKQKKFSLGAQFERKLYI